MRQIATSHYGPMRQPAPCPSHPHPRDKPRPASINPIIATYRNVTTQAFTTNRAQKAHSRSNLDAPSRRIATSPLAPTRQSLAHPAVTTILPETTLPAPARQAHPDPTYSTCRPRIEAHRYEPVRQACPTRHCPATRQLDVPNRVIPLRRSSSSTYRTSPMRQSMPTHHRSLPMRLA
jgi:hypothetical protein